MDRFRLKATQYIAVFRKWLIKDQIPRTEVFLAGYILLCLGLSYVLVLRANLSEALLIVLVAPPFWAFLRYQRWVGIAMLVFLVGDAVWVAFNRSGDIGSALTEILVAALTAAFTAYIFLWLKKRYDEAQVKLWAVADHAYNLELWRKADGAFAFVSPSSERITGYPPEAYLENPELFENIIYSEDRKKVTEGLQADQGRIEVRIVRPDRQIRWLEFIFQKMYGAGGEYLGERSSSRDITDYKMVEDALRSSAERLTLALEGTEDGVWDVDLTTGETYFSSNYAWTFGFVADQDDAKLQDLHALVHPDDLPELLKAFKEHLQGQSPVYHAEYRLRTRNGLWNWVLDRGKVIRRSPKGKPLRMVGTHVDITERKTIEGALQQSEKKFRQLTENMREVFWMRGRTSGQFIYVSPAYTEIWGRTTESLYKEAQSFMEGVHPDDLGRVYHAQKELFETQQIFNEEFRVIYPDGTMRWVWAREYPVLDADGEFYRTAGVVEDISDRKQVNAALMESEKRYRDLIEHQGGGVSIIDTEENIVYINPAGEDIFGVHRGTLTGRNLGDFLDDEQYSFLKKQSALRRKGVESSFEIAITRQNGEERNLLFTSTPRFDVNSQFLGTIAIFRDITKRKEKEEKLRYMSLHDALTGLNNRAFFEDEFNRVGHDGSLYPISVIMIDVDGLKQVNDTLGHNTGDELLVRVSNILKNSLRAGDIVARIGGDEFAVLLPNANEEALNKALGRISSSVESENKASRSAYIVSLSVGGYACHQIGNLKEALAKADARMYRAKEQKKSHYFVVTDPVDKEPED